ncbi:MAG TPA: LytR C-terminal domain-containing protein [Methylomirabilota bacterium]|nr:LytR C-terminal domain-containing protein [Methylomirabilota bacterium]
MEDTPAQESAYSVEKSSRKPGLIAVFFFILLLIIISLIALYFIGVRSKNSLFAPQTPSPTQTPTAMPTPTPLPLERSTLQIAILNGSGVPGTAKSISSYLSSLGYTIKVVGNADRFDYRNITVKVKKEQRAYLPLLQKDLSRKFSSVSASVSDDASADADVIVGR